MSRIHGLRAIIANSIENASVRVVEEGVYDGITDDRLAQITAAGKVEASAIVDGDKTIAFDGDLSFAGDFTTSGAFPMTFTATEATSLVLPASGTLATEAYVNTVAMGLDLKASVRVATLAALPAVTYDNGTDGLGATLTADASGALPDQDGVALVVGDRLLVKDQATALQNGIYVVTAVGDGSNPFVLTRSLDCDGTPANEVSGGMYTFVETGTQGGYGFAVIHDGNVALGTDAINFSLFSSADAYVAGNGIAITGQSIAIHPDYWDDIEAADDLDLAALVDDAAGTGETATGGLVKAHLQLLANIVNEAECTYDDFVKLHDLTVSAINLTDVALLSVLELSTGAALIGYDNSTSGLTSTNMQSVIDELVSGLGSAGGDLTALEGRIDNLNTAIGITGDAYASPTGVYLGSELSVVEGLTVLDNALDIEAQARAQLDLDLTMRLDNINSAVGLTGDSFASEGQYHTISSSTVSEALATLDEALNTEETTRADADTALSDRLDTLEGASSAAVDYEEVGLGDGTTTEFTVGNAAFVSGSLRVWVNGLLMKKGSGAEEVAETSDSAGTFTFGTAPATNDFIIVAYK